MMMRIEADRPNRVIRASKNGDAQGKAAKEFIKNARGSRYGDHENYKAAVRQYIADNKNNPSLITDMFAKRVVNALYDAIAWHGDVEMVSILLDAGFKVNVACHLQSNSTPLMCAAENGKLDIVKLLLERGADLLRINREGKTAEELATENGQFAVASYLKQQREKLAQVEKPPTRADELAQISMDENAVEPLFCCPISQRIMQKPITVLTGATYDADSLASAFIEAGNPHSIPCVVTGGRINREELKNPVTLVVDGLIKQYVRKRITKAELVGPSVGEEKGLPSQSGLFSASRALNVQTPGINSAAHNNSSAAVQVAASSSSDEAAAPSAEVVRLHTPGLKVG